MKDEVSHIFKNVIIGSLLLINLSLILYLLISDFSIEKILIEGEIFGLGDSFWGALLGTIITGSMVIKISNSEQKKRLREKEEETSKVLLNLKEYADDLLIETRRIIIQSVEFTTLFRKWKLNMTAKAINILHIFR